MIKLVGDFNRLTKSNTVYLGTVDTHEGLRNLGPKLREGLRVVVWDGGYEAEGILEREGEGWRARILLDTGRHAGTPEPDESQTNSN